MATVTRLRTRKPNRRPGATTALPWHEAAAACVRNGIPADFLARCAQVSGDVPAEELAGSVAVLEAHGPVTEPSVAMIPDASRR